MSKKSSKQTEAHDINLIRGFLIGKFRMWNPTDIVSIEKDGRFDDNTYQVTLSHEADIFFDEWNSMDSVFMSMSRVSMNFELNKKKFNVWFSWKKEVD